MGSWRPHVRTTTKSGAVNIQLFWRKVAPWLNLLAVTLLGAGLYHLATSPNPNTVILLSFAFLIAINVWLTVTQFRRRSGQPGV